MSLAYKDLKFTINKLGVLLFRLSYPARNEKQYWDKWASQPLNDLVFIIMRGLAEHQQKIIQLRSEEDYLRDQFQKIENTDMIEEDKQKITEFIRKEYRNLVRAEKSVYQDQLDFIKDQAQKVRQQLASMQQKTDELWEAFFDEQMKFIAKEMKKQGLSKEFKQIQKQIQSEG